LHPVSNSVRRARPLLGTFVEIAVADTASSGAQAAIGAAFGAVANVHRLMSFHDPGSDVARLNRRASTRAVRVHAWTYQVLETAVELHRRSNGVFDVAVAPILQDRGLLPRRDRDRPFVPTDTRARTAVELLSGHGVRFRHPDDRIDLGGIAKGFAVDRAVDALRAHQVSGGLVNAGGDIASFGAEPHAIHIRDPRDPRRLMCAVEIRNEALASSGPCFDPLRSARTFGSAVIDPRTAGMARAVIGATVRAPSCQIADALTKIVMIAGEGALALLKHYRASAMLVFADGDVRVTADWQEATDLAP
jgi:thiamine biosynthesis lipoprotein